MNVRYRSGKYCRAVGRSVIDHVQSVGRYSLAVGNFRFGLDFSKQVRICRAVGKVRYGLGTGRLVGTA